MSFILDALRKSELERQRQSGPSIAELPVARDDRRLPAALVAIALLLAVNAAVLAYFLLRDPPEAASPAIAAAAPAPAASGSSSAPAAGSGMPPAGSAALEPETAPEPQAQAVRPPEAPDPTLLPDAPRAGTVTYETPPASPPAAMAPQPAGAPELNVDLHIYSDDPAKRAVFINGRRYTEGMALSEGPTVEQITRDGAVINLRGQRYLLPRN
jgi:general secretion pathway protein B